MSRASLWKQLKVEAADSRSVMRMHALSLLCFADKIEDEVAEALKKGGRLTYTIEVTDPEKEQLRDGHGS